MNTLEIIRNGLMQCIERIEALIKRMSNAEATMKKQEEKINEGNNDAKISLSVVENFASSQFANFTYLYYEENGEIKSKVFNDGNVSEPQISSYVISGKPLSYKCWMFTEKVEFKNFNTSNVTSMNSMFKYSQLTSLDVTNFDTSAVTNMSYMFGNCLSLTSLELSNFNTAAVTDMSNMFYECDKLTSLDISNFNTSAVTNIDGIFFNCTQLTSIIGTHTLEEVQAGTVKAFKGLKVEIYFGFSPNLERASILALFYGLADLTGQTAQTVTLHATAKARLTAEDIKIATDKNWKVQ